MAYKIRSKGDDPVMSDLTILVSVEDLINLAMGPVNENTVNFKMIQTVLHILARQMRILETKVDLKIADVATLRKRRKKESSHSSDSPSSSASPKRETMEDIAEEARGEKEIRSTSPKRYKKTKADRTAKEKEKLSKMSPAEQEKYLKEKEEEEKLLAKMSPKEKDKYLAAKSSDDDLEEEVARKSKNRSKSIKDKEQKLLEQMSPEERNMYLKQKEMDEKIMQDMSPKERDQYLKQKEKEIKQLQGMSPQDKEVYFKEKAKEQETLLKMSAKEKDKYFKEKGKLEGSSSPREKDKKTKGEKDYDKPESKVTSKEKGAKSEKPEKASKEKQKKEKEEELKAEEQKETKALENMSPKEREKYLKEKEILENMSPKEREKYFKQKKKEKEALENMSPKEREQYMKHKEKEDEALEKMTLRERQKYLKLKEKEQETIEKLTPEEREKFLDRKEKEDEALGTMTPKEREKYLKHKEREQEALEKLSPAEKEKYLIEKKREEEALEKMTPIEKEKYLKEKEIQMAEQARASGSRSSIAITEEERQNEKVLIVEKGPTTRASKKKMGGIEVVTVSQFNLLAGEVEALKKVAGPLPMPAMPDNKQLRSDLVKGSASLTDTMQAMQVSARVQAAEEGLARMAGLLTQLAASGALPDAFMDQIEQARADMEALKGGLKEEQSKSKSSTAQGARKSVAIDAASSRSGGESAATSGGSRPPSAGASQRSSIAAISVAKRHSSSTGSRKIAVTRNEMDDAIQSLRDDLLKTVGQMTNRASNSAENAAGTAKAVADKMDIALKLNSRITDLYGLTAVYSEQLSGFDAGLTTQMQSFQEQMSQMREDMRVGLTQLDSANNNAETAAVLELTERYTGLENELEITGTEHHRLSVYQKQLGEDLRGLVEAVETLREQKADRDEVWDGLRDKADLTKLSGLLTEEEYERSRSELDSRLELCYDKFNKQEVVWLQVVKDLVASTQEKAEVMALLSIKHEAQDQLTDLQEKLKMLELQLGEPKAAILTRILSKDGACAACRVPALMEGEDKTAGLPAPLPHFRTPLDVCAPQNPPVVLEDRTVKSHVCKRWVGGSHTLLPRSAPREVASAPLAPSQPIKRFTGYGADGKLYKMAEELEPCLECNMLSTDEVKGAGDASAPPDRREEVEEACPCNADESIKGV